MARPRDPRGRRFRGAWAWVLRVVLASCAVAVLVALLTAGGSLIGSARTPSLDLGSPWTSEYQPSRLDEAIADSPPGSLSTKLAITQMAADHAGDSVFTIQVEVSGAADQPVLTAIRAGAQKDAPVGVVLDLAGLPTFSSFGPTYSAPTVHISGATATAVIKGHLAMPRDELGQIAVSGIFSCPVFKQRTISIKLRDYDIVGARALPPPTGDSCPTGSWPSQADTSARYDGTRSVTVDVVPVATAGSMATSTRPLVNVDPSLRDSWLTLYLGLLTALPVVIVWWRLRQPAHAAGGLVDGRPRVGVPVLVAIGSVLAFHSVVTVVAGLFNEFNLAEEHFGDLRLGGRHFSLTSQVLYALLIVALGYVWRRATLERLGADGGRHSGRRVVAFLLLGAVALLAAVPAASGWLPRFAPGPSEDGYGWSDWLRGWPGPVAVGLSFAVLVGGVLSLTLPGLARRLPGRIAQACAAKVRNRRAVFMLGALVGAAVFVLTMLVGRAYGPAYYDPYDDEMVHENWTTWAASIPGVMTALGIGLVVLVFVVLVVASNVIPTRSRWREIAVVGTFTVPTAVLVGVGYVVATLAEPAESRWLGPVPGGGTWLSGAPGSVTTVLVLLVAAALTAVLLPRVLGLGRGVAGPAVVGVAAVLALLAFGSVTGSGGIIGTVVSAAPPLVAGAAVWLTLGALCVSVLAEQAPRSWFPAIGRLRNLRGLGWLVALLLSVPVATYATAGPRIDWYNFVDLVSGIDRCLALLVVGVLLVVSARLGGGEPEAGAQGGPHAIRAVAVLLAVVGLLTPTATAKGIPVSFLIGWLLIEVWLLPRRLTRRRNSPAAVGFSARRRAVTAITAQARRAAELRASTAMERGLRKDLSAEGIGTAERRERLDAVQQLTARRRRGIRGTAFATFGGVAPWTRGCVLGLVGFVVGLPWMLVDLGTLFSSTGTFRLLDGAAALLVLLRFTLAGFVMGLAFPSIRGRTGVGKGLTLFVAFAAANVCATLLPDPHAHGALGAAVLQVAQWLAVGLLLGLAADLWQLRRAGLGWRSLADVHNLTAITASLSSVVLALVTAAATALGTSAASIAVDRLVPPSSTSTPGTSTTATR